MAIPSPAKIKNKGCCQARKCSYFTCHSLLVLSFTHDHWVDKIFKRMCCVLSEAFEMSNRGCQQRSSGRSTLCSLLGPVWAKCYENRPVTLKDLCFNTQGVFSRREFGLDPRRAHCLCCFRSLGNWKMIKVHFCVTQCENGFRSLGMQG